MSPVVEAVSRSTAHGFSKTPQTSVHLIPGEGVEGDAHRGVTAQHLYVMRRDPTRPNFCQVHLFAAEMLDELAAKGFNIAPGDLGENILTRNLDLLSLPLGTRLHLGAEAIVEVTGLRTPCSKIDDFRPGLQQHLWGERDASDKRVRRAGIMSIVITEGDIRPGDAIQIELPPHPHHPLGPV
ncbi:MAG TPA: MOSC domain-containing protein [Acidobacteriaceae bacterium]